MLGETTDPKGSVQGPGPEGYPPEPQERNISVRCRQGTSSRRETTITLNGGGAPHVERPEKGPGRHLKVERSTEGAQAPAKRP